MKKICFACFTPDQRSLSKALLLVESIRTFCAEYASAPIWFMIPQGASQPGKKTRAKQEALEVDLQSFELDNRAAAFPFAGKVVASAAAENLALKQADQLVWMDTLSLVIKSPDALLLDPAVFLGCRPVDHLLIGPPFEKPLDPFWEHVYQSCDVQDADIFPMITSADQVKIRPYINAGMLVVRPGQKLLEKWAKTFLQVYQDKRFIELYEKQRLYKIFIHQAVLSATIIASIDQAQITLLPHYVNYPLHMHAQYPAHKRPSTIDQLVSFRYERFFAKTNWREIIQVEPPLKGWLDEREKILAQG